MAQGISGPGMANHDLCISHYIPDIWQFAGNIQQLKHIAFA